MLRVRLAASLLISAAVPAVAASQQAPLVFTGVSVIPMDRDTVLRDQTVIVEGGRITHVGGARRAPAGATTIDGRGKFLMPGISEFHAHVPSGQGAVHAPRTLSLYVLAGVTTARGMLGAPMHLRLRDSIAAGTGAFAIVPLDSDRITPASTPASKYSTRTACRPGLQWRWRRSRNRAAWRSTR